MLRLVPGRTTRRILRTASGLAVLLVIGAPAGTAVGQIVAVGPDSEHALVAMNDDGSGMRVLAERSQLGGSISALDVSADGSVVVIEVASDSCGSISDDAGNYFTVGLYCSALYKLQSGQLTRLTQPQAPPSETEWSGEQDPRITSDGRVMFKFSTVWYYHKCYVGNVCEYQPTDPMSSLQSRPLAGGPASAVQVGGQDLTADFGTYAPNPLNPATVAWVAPYDWLSYQSNIMVDDLSVAYDDQAPLALDWTADGSQLLDLERGADPGLWMYPSTPGTGDAVQLLTLNDTSPQSARMMGSDRVLFSSDGNLYTIPTSCRSTSCTFPGSAQALTSGPASSSGGYRMPAWTRATQPIAGLPPLAPPTIHVPATMTSEAASGGGVAVTYTVNATDRAGAAVNTTCRPASGSTFPIGETIVSCTARDASGKTASASFAIVVTHLTGPVLSMPQSLTTTAADGSGAIVTYTSTAVDSVDGQITPTCTPASGSRFKPGTTTVTCTAADKAGNTSKGTFTVTVKANPQLIALRLLPATFRAAARGPSVVVRGSDGAKLSYNLTAAGTVTFKVERATSGRRQGKSCLAATRERRRLPRCTRYVPVKGSFSQTGRQGMNSVRFSGRINNKALKPGRYRLIAATHGASTRSAPFTIRR